ncbi:MAG: hypothetical protein WC910_05235 [Bacteroidales bacterium]|jgi:hypothetical protein
MEKRHYTAGGNPSHAGVFILPNGNNIDVVIDHIEWREKEKINGRVESKFIAILKPNQYTDLPMVLNKINKERVLKLAGKGSWDILFIKDLPVTLTWEPTKLSDGLRVSPIPPRQRATTTTKATTTTQQQLEPLTTAHKNFSKCVDHLKNGGTIDDLRAKYTISNAMEETLKQALL